MSYATAGAAPGGGDVALQSHGGKILRDRTEIPQVGWMAVSKIPGGVVQAIVQPARPM